MRTLAAKLLVIPALLGLALPRTSQAAVERQPFTAQVNRVLGSTDYVGAPLPQEAKERIFAAMRERDPEAAVNAMQAVLDEFCLFQVDISPEMRVKVEAGAASPLLVQGDWTQFLVRVNNKAGTTAALRVESPQALATYEASGKGNWIAEKLLDEEGVKRDRPGKEDQWLEITSYGDRPMSPRLSGLEVEYRILHLYSRDAGKREAKVSFNVGQGTQDLGFRAELDTLFTCRAAHDITLRVRDESGEPTTASFEIRDAGGRIFPAQANRLAPDFGFHPQVYRADGESVHLPAGDYTVTFSRGPESIPQTVPVKVTDQTKELVFKTERWIEPSKFGWWSGDHHIHAAGCKHYTFPSLGVHAPDMIRHCVGEDLKIGANLTWGPCFDYQKQFFTGDIDKVSVYPYLLRYDIEVSGFGSHQSGHLCLLRLRDEIYPGGDSDKHWPKLCLNTLKWAKAQGALVGPAHSGWGLALPTDDLPNYNVPPFDGIGANEYIVDVTHQVPGPEGKPVPAVDFLSMVDTPSIWELNIWYHTLNCGFRTRVSGETDFPCIYGERVGLGRSYVKLDGKLDYNDWCEAIRVGRNYVSDGRSHIMDFAVNGQPMGVKGSELKLGDAGKVRVTARVAARLDEQPDPAMANLRVDQKPFWNVERARIAGTRKVPVEVIVNGYPVARQEIVADGTLSDVTFEVPVTQSSWVALRILPSSHTNPVFVLVDGKPIRASRRSAEWCLKGVEKCWSQKERFIDADEMADAKAAYAHARATYQNIIRECEVE